MTRPPSEAASTQRVIDARSRPRGRLGEATASQVLATSRAHADRATSPPVLPIQAHTFDNAQPGPWLQLALCPSPVSQKLTITRLLRSKFSLPGRPGRRKGTTGGRLSAGAARPHHLNIFSSADSAAAVPGGPSRWRAKAAIIRRSNRGTDDRDHRQWPRGGRLSIRHARHRQCDGTGAAP
jgi:hypothetical protein